MGTESSIRGFEYATESSRTKLINRVLDAITKNVVLQAELFLLSFESVKGWWKLLQLAFAAGFESFNELNTVVDETPRTV